MENFGFQQNPHMMREILPVDFKHLISSRLNVNRRLISQNFFNQHLLKTTLFLLKEPELLSYLCQVKFESEYLSFRQLGLFSKLFLDYCEGKNEVREFYQFEANSDGILQFTRQHDYADLNRSELAEIIKKQYDSVSHVPPQVEDNLHVLNSANTFTITTGHQLCLFTGPLYFIYKILSVVVLCERLNKIQNEKKFVPVYWMASEDHDIAEIDHAHLFYKTIRWSTTETGKAGKLSTSGLTEIIEELKAILGEHPNAEKIIELFKDAYLEQPSLADATRHLVTALFGKWGLIVVDGDDTKLKKQFKAIIREDILGGHSFKLVEESIKRLSEKGYDIQVNPRQINCFYSLDNIRERLVYDGERYVVLNTDIHFDKDAFLQELNKHPERFSPNVVTRPLYQQCILPNAAYVGGPGELAYWLEYKSMFDFYRLPFPALIPRKFVAILDSVSVQRMENLGIMTQDLFRTQQELERIVMGALDLKFSVEQNEKMIRETFAELHSRVSQVDITLEGAVAAELQKALNGLKSIEVKTLRALKLKHEVALKQTESIRKKIFPEGIFQERLINFTEYYLRDLTFVDQLKEKFGETGMANSILILKEEK